MKIALFMVFDFLEIEAATMRFGYSLLILCYNDLMTFFILAGTMALNFR